MSTFNMKVGRFPELTKAAYVICMSQHMLIPRVTACLLLCTGIAFCITELSKQQGEPVQTHVVQIMPQHAC